MGVQCETYSNAGARRELHHVGRGSRFYLENECMLWVWVCSVWVCSVWVCSMWVYSM
jgi:hypothetical protein